MLFALFVSGVKMTRKFFGDFRLSFSQTCCNPFFLFTTRSFFRVIIGFIVLGGVVFFLSFGLRFFLIFVVFLLFVVGLVICLFLFLSFLFLVDVIMIAFVTPSARLAAIYLLPFSADEKKLSLIYEKSENSKLLNQQCIVNTNVGEYLYSNKS